MGSGEKDNIISNTISISNQTSISSLNSEHEEDIDTVITIKIMNFLFLKIV